MGTSADVTICLLCVSLGFCNENLTRVRDRKLVRHPGHTERSTDHAFRLGFVGATWRIVTSADVTICFWGVSLGFYNENLADRNVGSRFKKYYNSFLKRDPTLRSARFAL